VSLAHGCDFVVDTWYGTIDGQLKVPCPGVLDVLDSKKLLGAFQQRFYVNLVLVAAVVHSVAET